MFFISRYYIFAYVCFGCIAFAAGVQQFDQDKWLPLLSNGAFGVTALYSYEKKRYDLAVLGIIVMGASLVWHSSGNYGPVDFMFTRIFAFYAFLSTVVNPSVALPLIVLFCVLNEFWEYESGKETGSKSAFDDLEMTFFIPLILVLVLYRLYARYAKKDGAITWTFAASVVVGIVGLVMFYALDSKIGHSAWHVLGALSVALTIEPETQEDREEETEEETGESTGMLKPFNLRL